MIKYIVIGFSAFVALQIVISLVASAVYYIGDWNPKMTDCCGYSTLSADIIRIGEIAWFFILSFGGLAILGYITEIVYQVIV